MSQPWHLRTPDDVVASLGSSKAGLTSQEAAERLQRSGPNTFATIPGASWQHILLSQLRGVVVWLLVAATAISVAVGDHTEAFAILAVLVINTVIGFVTEWRAHRAIEALTQLDVPQAIVVRDGATQVVEARTLVPGDLVELHAGKHVPADGRLIEAADLSLDEAPLTGESLPVSKRTSANLVADTPLAERVTMAFKGTMAVAGFGRLVVTATGSETEVGKIGVLTGGVEVERTPLERQLDALGRRLVWITIGIAMVIGAVSLAQGMAMGLVLQTAIALAVAAVPEALPAVATVALAVGVHRMARRHALVRQLPAVESLGSTTVICTDKTRTLTSGTMTVVSVWTAGERSPFPTESPVQPATRALIEAAVLASRETTGDGKHVDPVDAAMISAGDALTPRAAGRGAFGHLESWIPFSSDRKWMAAFYLDGSKRVAFVKGAPRTVLERSEAIAWVDGPRRIDETIRAQILSANDTLGKDGLRVIAIARGPAEAATEPSLRGLTLLGLVGLADPPAPGVQDTIARLKAAGLRTVMLTGDQRATAEAIGRSLGMMDTNAEATDGRELDRLSESQVEDLVDRRVAFTRVTPEHKLQVIRALRRRGEVVAMLGDGINDAAALRQADVGVAMGRRGTDVAKQAAAIVLQDDRFETIAAAVEEGRVIFDNIRKFVFYLFSCNLAEVLVLLCAALVGLPLPLLPLHLLWLNIVTDTFPALALALEPGDPMVMKRPPRRPDEALFSRGFLTAVVGYAALITASTMAAFVWALQGAPEKATTVAFITLGLGQTFHLANARGGAPVLGWRRGRSNPFALAGVGIAIALQVLSLQVAALAHLLDLVPLSARELLTVTVLAAVPAVVGQGLKVARSR